MTDQNTSTNLYLRAAPIDRALMVSVALAVAFQTEMAKIANERGVELLEYMAHTAEVQKKVVTLLTGGSVENFKFEDGNERIGVAIEALGTVLDLVNDANKEQENG